MLIRSQDKTRIVNIYMLDSIIIQENNTIVGHGGKDGISYVLGNYSSKEKALEVLDNIGGIYKDFCYMMATGNVAPSYEWCSVFDMPK